MLRTIALLASVPLFVAGCGERPLEPRDPTPGAVHFTIKTYNVETDEQNHSRTIEAIGSGDADVVFLQETSPGYEAVLRKRFSAQYPHQLYNHNAPEFGTGGLAVLSHFPIQDGGFHKNPNGWHPAWHILVETPAGKMQVMNVHLRAVFNGDGNAVSDYLSVKSDHLNEISAFMEDCGDTLPTLVVGDFNEGPGGQAVRYLEDRGFQNALPLFHPGQFTWRHASVANQLNQTLDHILFDGSFSPLNAWVINAGDSDHIPVVAHLEAAYDWEPASRVRSEPMSTRAP
jgi:endonuclease/exonuclease/phosphatase family metal-dependent hydrolase